MRKLATHKMKKARVAADERIWGTSSDVKSEVSDNDQTTLIFSFEIADDVTLSEASDERRKYWKMQNQKLILTLPNFFPIDEYAMSTALLTNFPEFSTGGFAWSSISFAVGPVECSITESWIPNMSHNHYLIEALQKAYFWKTWRGSKYRNESPVSVQISIYSIRPPARTQYFPDSKTYRYGNRDYLFVIGQKKLEELFIYEFERGLRKKPIILESFLRVGLAKTKTIERYVEPLLVASDTYSIWTGNYDVTNPKLEMPEVPQSFFTESKERALATPFDSVDQAALDAYLGRDYYKMNHSDPVLAHKIHRLQDIILKSPTLKTPATVLRGIILNDVGEFDGPLLPGAILNTGPHFMSVTYGKVLSRFIGSVCCILHISLPVGFPVLLADWRELDSAKSFIERELILPMFFNWKFVKRQRRTYRRREVDVIYLEAIIPDKWERPIFQPEHMLESSQKLSEIAEETEEVLLPTFYRKFASISYMFNSYAYQLYKGKNIMELNALINIFADRRYLPLLQTGEKLDLPSTEFFPILLIYDTVNPIRSILTVYEKIPFIAQISFGSAPPPFLGAFRLIYLTLDDDVSFFVTTSTLNYAATNIVIQAYTDIKVSRLPKVASRIYAHDREITEIYNAQISAKRCFVCAKIATYICDCYVVGYCSKEHQKFDWKNHKKNHFT